MIRDRLLRGWQWLPVVVRALFLGLAVLLVGVGPWSALATANLKIGSSVPWAFVAEVALLWLLWLYLSGRGWPSSTRELRQGYLRAGAVPKKLRRTVVVAGALFSAALVGLTLLVWMLVSLPSAALEQYRSLDNLSPWTVVPTLLMGSVVAGVVEEAAFRGYMQVPLERRYGPVVGIVVVAVAFTLTHLPPPSQYPVFAAGALGWGVLAYLAGSIRPGIVFHAAIDAVAWVWAWVDPGSLERLLESTYGGGTWSPLLGIALAWTSITVAGTLWAFQKLAGKRRSPVASTAPCYE